jgi:hypothetical protein
MERPTRENRSGGSPSPDESARRLTIVLGAPLALIVSALALFQFL